MVRSESNGQGKPWVQSPFRWAGSKRRMLPLLAEAMPLEYDRYIEPMVGSGCLFFALRPDAAIIGDFNEELMGAYSCIRKHPRRVARTAASWGEEPADYYAIRALDPGVLDEVTRAARFVYLNRFSFNGVYRTNRKGQFNVPRGRDTGALPSEGRFYRCSVALRQAELAIGDFQETAYRAESRDFVYLDPPYSTTRPNQGEYGYGSFGTGDEARLYETLFELDRRGALFLLSYGGSRPTIDTPSNWSWFQFSSTRTVGGWSDRRPQTPEFLLANYEIPLAV